MVSVPHFCCLKSGDFLSGKLQYQPHRIFKKFKVPFRIESKPWLGERKFAFHEIKGPVDIEMAEDVFGHEIYKDYVRIPTGAPLYVF